MVHPTQQVLAYIEDLYAGNALNKTDYTQVTRPAAGGDVIDDDVARFFQLLLLLKRPQRILEIGTSVGYSTVAMAQVVQPLGGRITTIELDPQTAVLAQGNFLRYGVDHSIEVLVGDAEALVPTLPGSFDYIFMDVGKKSLYRDLLDWCVRKLSPGGLLVAEDSLYGAFHQEPRRGSGKDGEFADIARVLHEFNSGVARHPELESTLLPIGDGVTVAVKRYSQQA